MTAATAELLDYDDVVARYEPVPDNVAAKLTG